MAMLVLAAWVVVEIPKLWILPRKGMPRGRSRRKNSKLSRKHFNNQGMFSLLNWGKACVQPSFVCARDYRRRTRRIAINNTLNCGKPLLDDNRAIHRVNSASVIICACGGEGVAIARTWVY